LRLKILLVFKVQNARLGLGLITWCKIKFGSYFISAMAKRTLINQQIFLLQDQMRFSSVFINKYFVNAI